MATSNSSNKAAGRVLLPLTINPTRYDITLTPDLTNFTFAGVTTIELTTSADVSTSNIVMHAKELCFSHAYYTVKGEETKHEAEEISVIAQATTVSFGFATPIPPNSTLLLAISYSGLLNNEMAGFYRSSYKNIQGETKIMASTYFAPLYARRCFPCWDEPAHKAVFGVTLIVPKELDAFSNMPESSHKTFEGGTKKELTFLDTPIMSTYLLAFVIGEFDYVQAQTAHGVLVRVYTPPRKK
jgi:aminopeptidase N